MGSELTALELYENAKSYIDAAIDNEEFKTFAQAAANLLDDPSFRAAGQGYNSANFLPVTVESALRHAVLTKHNAGEKILSYLDYGYNTNGDKIDKRPKGLVDSIAAENPHHGHLLENLHSSSHSRIITEIRLTEVHNRFNSFAIHDNIRCDDNKCIGCNLLCIHFTRKHL